MDRLPSTVVVREKYIKEFNLGPSDLVVDIGSNDGIALKPLKANHVKVAGVEPAINISDMANKQGILTYCDYFSNTVVKSIISDHGPATIVTASNVFAHSDTLREMSTNAYDLLKDNGTFIIEVQYLLDTINDLTFDNIYHEHFNYWSVTSLVNFFNVISLPIQKKFYVSHVEHIDTHGGSIRVYVKKGEKNIDSTVEKFLNDEEKSGIKNYETYKNFAKRVKDARTTVINNMKLLKSKYKTIAGYGSPAKATTALNYFGIDNSYIDYIIEDNKMKVGKFLPGVNIPIKDKTEVYKSSPDVIIVMAWNFIDEIKKNNQKLIDDGVTFISIKDLQNIDFPKMINTTKYA